MFGQGGPVRPGESIKRCAARLGVAGDWSGGSYAGAGAFAQAQQVGQGKGRAAAEAAGALKFARAASLLGFRHAAGAGGRCAGSRPLSSFPPPAPALMQAAASEAELRVCVLHVCFVHGLPWLSQTLD